MRYLLASLGFLMLLFVASPLAHAQMADTDFSLVTGSSTGTYYRIGHDIADTVSEDMQLDVEQSFGSIDNIERLAANSGILLGMVQSDVLGVLRRSTEPNASAMAEDLRLVMPLYPEEVHVLAQKTIRRFDQLSGKRVVVGKAGSGNWLTAMNLFALTRVTPAEELQLSPEEGAVAVLRGKADAMIFVGGKPVQLFNNLANLSADAEYGRLLRRVHLLPLSEPVLLAEYDQTYFLPDDYSFISNTVPTIAVSALLVSYQHDGMSTEQQVLRCKAIAIVSSRLTRSLGTLSSSGHPKWRQVSPESQPLSWQRDPCAKEATTAGTALEQELLRVLQRP